MSELNVTTLTITDSLLRSTYTGQGVTVNTTSITESATGAFVINTNAITIGTGATNTMIQAVFNEPSINVNANNTTRLPSNETCNVQIFTANGTWTTPVWFTGSGELIIVHAWGGGGGGNVSSGGGGGAMLVGYYLGGTDVTANVTVTVGSGGSIGVAGGDSIFNAPSPMTASGGGQADASYGGGGAGWWSGGAPFTGGDPLGGIGNSDSTFGGGGGSQGAGISGGSSIYGGGGGGLTTGAGGSSIYGGGGGTSTGQRGTSVYGGFGGNTSISASTPGGGGASQGAGARGEVRVYTIRKYT